MILSDNIHLLYLFNVRLSSNKFTPIHILTLFIYAIWTKTYAFYRINVGKCFIFFFSLLCDHEPGFLLPKKIYIGNEVGEEEKECCCWKASNVHVEMERSLFFAGNVIIVFLLFRWDYFMLEEISKEKRRTLTHKNTIKPINQ